MHVEQLAGTDLGVHTRQYEERDAILYALAVGAPHDDLSLVYERDLQVLPTFATTLGLWAVESAGTLGAYDPTTSLHVSQHLEITAPLPRSGEIEMHGRIANVWDRGSAAMIDIDVDSDWFRVSYGIYVKGLGGFGGAEPPRATEPATTGDPTTTTYATDDGQAALYRLTGDLHPVHIDPDVAGANGFARPILHGLCTFGIAVREAANALGRHPTEVRSADARLAAPVLPGDEIATTTTPTQDGAVFVAEVGETRVLKGGRIVLDEEAADG